MILEDVRDIRDLLERLEDHLEAKAIEAIGVDERNEINLLLEEIGHGLGTLNDELEWVEPIPTHLDTVRSDGTEGRYAGAATFLRLLPANTPERKEWRHPRGLYRMRPRRDV